ncbi:hypothetical protein JOC24_006032 [Streptomyces sp. HB132]|nr:hypothetical protein [Streptomyces sp. HB132]
MDKVPEHGAPGTEECAPGTDPGFGGKRLAADVEGLALLREPGGDGYPMASGQGDNTFALSRAANGFEFVDCATCWMRRTCGTWPGSRTASRVPVGIA